MERLIYTQNQFNVFPSELLVGNSKTLPPWCATHESVNPCDSSFLKKWISSYTVSLRDIRNLDYYAIENYLLSHRRFSDLLNTYVKNLLPAWKSWKDSCYKVELKPRGDEMPCDCQRISSNYRTMYNGKYFVPQAHPYSPIQIQINSSANGKAIPKFWDGTDGKSLFHGNIFGPTMWVVHETWGSCTPDFYGPEYNAANRMVNPPNPPYKAEDAPLSQSFIMMYTCSNKNPYDENYWPKDCACPLDVQGKIYLEATLMTSADFRSNCFWDTYARADVETAGLGLVRVYKPSRPIVAGTLRKSGDVLYWNSGLAAAQSSYRSRFNFGTPFEALFYLGLNILESALVDWVAIPGTTGGASPLQKSWQDIAPLKKTFASGPIKKNEVLVDLNWRHQLGANFPIEAVLYNFYKISAKGQDGWFSKAALETRGVNTYFIEANEPSPSQSQYCCNDFIARWFHSGEGGVWNIDMKNKVESFVNLNNTVPWITVKTNDNYNDHLVSMDCNLFSSFIYKGAGNKHNPYYAFRSENHLRWTHSSDEEHKIEVIDIMGKLLYSNRLVPQKDNVIINLNNFGSSLLFISISGSHGDQLFKVKNN